MSFQILMLDDGANVTPMELWDRGLDVILTTFDTFALPPMLQKLAYRGHCECLMVAARPANDRRGMGEG